MHSNHFRIPFADSIDRNIKPIEDVRCDGKTRFPVLIDIPLWMCGIHEEAYMKTEETGPVVQVL